jgi:pericentriolar material 1 protein
MVQIIPVVKQQMNGICSQQLLHYIQQLTLSLTRLQQLHQQPQSRSASSSHTNEFARFFHRQLDTILRDSLAKFEGRK